MVYRRSNDGPFHADYMLSWVKQLASAHQTATAELARLKPTRESAEALLKRAVRLVAKIGTSGIDASVCMEAEEWLTDVDNYSAHLEQKVDISK